MMKKVFIFTALVLFTTSMAMGVNNLAGYWKFDEGTGTTVNDSSGNAKNGVLQSRGGGALPAWTADRNGVAGKALLFNDTATSYTNSGEVKVPILATDMLANIAPTPTQAFTIVMWIRSDRTNGTYRGILNTKSYSLKLAFDPCSATIDNEDNFECDNNWACWTKTLGKERDAQYKYDGGIPVWNHVAITYDGNFLRKYINGNVHYLTYPNTLRAGLPANTADDLTIGAAWTLYWSEGSYFTGAIDDVAIYKDRYLKREEIQKLVDGSATPLTVTPSPVEGLLPVKNWTKEPDLAWTTSGWKTVWSTGFSWDAGLNSSTDKRLWNASGWWIESAILPGGRSPIWLWCKWHPERLPTDVNDANVYQANWFSDGTMEQGRMDDTKYGLEWVDEAHSGRAAEVAVFAAYITPGYAITQNDWGYHPYNPDPQRSLNWENKPYFKTYSRFTTTGAPAGSQMLVQLFTYNNNDADANVTWSAYLNDPTCLTKYAEVSIPILGGDWEWQQFKGALPKPKILGGSSDHNEPNAGNVLFMITIEGGDADTVLYVDEFGPIGDQTLHPGGSNTFLEGDINKSSIVYFDDLLILAGEWLGNVGDIVEPRSGGLLTNGDFYADYALLPPGPNDVNLVVVDPTGWTITGTGDYGIRRTAKTGRMNYGLPVTTPMGGSVSVQLTDMTVDDPYGVLEQTASAAAVSGQTYYAMGYVMTPGWSPTLDDWKGWKDTATMEIVVNGVVKATFSRRLSRDVWRPLYGSYTAVADDNGLPITIRFSYDNTFKEPAESGTMLVGYTYLGTTMPEEYPDARDNKVINGGFEDLSTIQSLIPALYTSLTTSDNWGAWFVSGVPTPPSWVYEVPSGYDLADKGGIWASGIYGTPVPTSGMHDIAVYTSNTLKLGQVIGSLTAGTTYYMDMACGINNANYLQDTTWPPDHNYPAFHIELWRIPAGVTDGATIYNAIAGGNPSYVKVAQEKAIATGNVAGSNWPSFYTLSSKWQIIGTQYTATSADTHMYVRVYGIGGKDVNDSGVASVKPQYAFSDVYVSTQKRVIPGGGTTFNISGGMLGDDLSHVVPSHVQKYEVAGPYDCYHAVLMGTNQGDVDGNCRINLVDYAAMAENWLQPLFNDISGDPLLP